MALRLVINNNKGSECKIDSHLLCIHSLLLNYLSSSSSSKDFIHFSYLLQILFFCKKCCFFRVKYSIISLYTYAEKDVG